MEGPTTRQKNECWPVLTFVRTAGSGYHNHFKEPLKFPLIILITFEDFRVLGKKIPNGFQPCWF